MAEKHVCPHCQKEFKRASALTSHIKFKHPGELRGKPPQEKPPEQKEVPDAAIDFKALLNEYGVTRAEIIVKNIAATGSPHVFDDPKELASKLAKWPRDMAPMYRASIMEHWFKSRGITLPEELLEEVGMEDDEKKVKDKKAEAEKKRGEGAVWTVDVDERGMPEIRMIKDEKVPGVTLAEAKLAAKEIGKEHEEPIVVYKEELGRHMPNFKSPFVKQNLNAAWATARQMDKGMAEGESVDPMDIWLEQQMKFSQLKEAMGAAPESKGTVGEIVTVLKDLKQMTDEGRASALPAWMTDPLAFTEAIKGITGGKGEGSEVKAAMVEMQRTIAELKEDRWRSQFEAQQKQIGDLTSVLNKTLESIADMKKESHGKTEMDILHEIAEKGIDLAKTELPGLRRDIKEAVSSVALPAPRSTEQREDRKKKFKQAIDTDREIEELGRRVFFGNG